MGKHHDNVPAKITTSLRNTQNEQLTKLQYKHQVDIDLLDDIRNFTKLRASIEKEYGQALLKLSANFLQRKFLTITPEKRDGSGNKVVYQVWKTLLDETEKIAKARLAAVEVYQQQISESAKLVRGAKLHVAKKCFDNMRKMHEEIQTCVTEIDKTKKLYFEEEHMAHGAREKATDADEKLKRKRGRIFQSIAALQKNSAKFSSRKEACDIQSTKARNDYILALVAANAHQKRFYSTDLPDIIQSLDCGFCENVREYIVLMARTELLTCAACQNSYTKVQQEGECITAQYTLECFLTENPVLGSMVQYNFDPCDEDPLQSISLEHNAALCLSKEARKWASCIAKETRTLRDCTKEHAKVQAQIAAGERNESTADGGTVDLETRMDELKQIIRRAETSKLKAEARIEVLRDGGVNVNEWLKPIEGETLALHDDLSRKGSTSSRSSNFSSHSEVAGEASSEANDSVYDSDFNDAASDVSVAARIPSVSDTDSVIETQRDVIATVTEAWDSTAVAEAWAEVESSVAESVAELQEKPPSVDNTEYGVTTGTKCVALFNYEALNSDELGFVEQEELEIIDEGEGDGWIKARNYKGEEGFIPQNYVEIIEVPSGDPSSGRSGLVSFSSVDYTMPGEDEISGLATEANDSQGSGPPTSLDLEVTTATSGAPPIAGNYQLCRAIYDYEATCDEELTFMEGQVIEIMRKTVHDVDDGWWEGRINGMVGIFPSLVVEELKMDGEPQTPQDLFTPPGSAPPPLYTPPKPMFLVPPAQVILTQPTPETEHVNDGTKPQASWRRHWSILR